VTWLGCLQIIMLTLDAQFSTLNILACITAMSQNLFKDESSETSSDLCFGFSLVEVILQSWPSQSHNSGLSRRESVVPTFEDRQQRSCDPM
jgi:hypothetical protein